jgi:hypothetical protein
MLVGDGASPDNGPKNYASYAPTKHATLPFEQAVLLLCPWSNSPRPGSQREPGRHKRITDLLNDRAQYGAIHGWRFGRRKAPQWACDLLASHLRRHVAECMAVIDALTKNEKGANQGAPLTK